MGRSQEKGIILSMFIRKSSQYGIGNLLWLDTGGHHVVNRRRSVSEVESPATLNRTKSMVTSEVNQDVLSYRQPDKLSHGEA